MIRRVVICYFGIVVLTCLIHSSASACSVGISFIQPSNYDLVKEADAIVLAEADRVIGEPDEEDRSVLLEFKALKTLKGYVGNDIIRTLAVTRVDFFMGRSKDNDFSAARPGADAGACIAEDYRLGYKYLLFLEKVSGEWVIMSTPFARVNEEVEGLDSSWARAVQAYINISALNDYEREKQALRKLLERDADMIPGLVEDIKHYFNWPSEHKSFDDNLSLYENSKSKLVKDRVLWVFANAEDERAMPLVNELLVTGEWRQYIPQVSRLIEATGDKEGVKLLYDELPRMANFMDRANALSAIIAMADDNDKEKMLTLLRTIDSRDKLEVAQWFIKHPSEDAVAIMRAYVDRRYRSEWQSAVVLSGLGDTEILEWAQEFMNSQDEDRWKAFYVVACSPLPGANNIAREIIHGDDAQGLTALIQGYQDSSNPDKFNLLAEIIQSNPKDQEVRKWLKSTLETLAYRKGEERAKELLKLIDY